MICSSVCIVFITIVRSISMSISGMTGTSASGQRLATASTQFKSITTAQDASATASSSGGTSSAFSFASAVDGISVGLPNGISVGAFHIGPSAGAPEQEGGTSAGSGSDASFSQMIDMVEQLVAAFENSPAATASTATQASTTDGTSPGGTSASATSGSGSDTSIDGISVDLPNGFSVEVFHADQGNGISADGGASSDQMVNTIEQLVAALDKYPGAAAGAYSNVGANASSASTTTGSLNAVA
jgi:hypothetical protein